MPLELNLKNISKCALYKIKLLDVILRHLTKLSKDNFSLYKLFECHNIL